MSSNDEKRDATENAIATPGNEKAEQDSQLHKQMSVANGETEEEDPFLPFSDVEPYDGRPILTVRAVLSGIFLGSLISCSNLYLGLKTGFGADATLFSAIFGYAICKLLEKSKIPFISAPFGPHENNIIQAVSLGCIGIGFMFISGVPAMYQLKLLSVHPESDYGKMICFTLVAGFWGLGFAVPMRSLFILRLARQLQLRFPLGTASALTIRALHSARDGTSQARDSIKTISASFSISLVWSVATSYASGIFYRWNPFWWIYKWGGKGAISAVSWGWLTWTWSPSLIGIGMMIDLNASMSYVFGTVLAWGIIGPILVAKGVAIGIPAFPNYPDMVTYNAFIPTQFETTPSPRYWILWPAIFMMLSTSLTAIALEVPSLTRMVKLGGKELGRKVMRKGGEHTSLTLDDDVGLVDPVAKEHRVRWWEWSSVALAAFVFSLIALKYLFGIPPAYNLLNLALGFFWSFVVIQIYAASGTLATGTVAKGSQFITGAILRGELPSRGYESAARINLIGTSVSAAATQQSAELCQDFRTGYLLGTPSRSQWYAQMLGTLSAVFLSPAIFMLFCKAYPCIIDTTATTCQFAMPAVTSWRIVTQAILSERFPIVKSSWICTIIMSLTGVASVLFKRWLSSKPKLQKYEKWVPSLSIAGLAMTIPGTETTLSIAIGSVIAYFWARYSPKTHARFFYATAAGGIAGEGIGYVILSVLQIAQVGGSVYGTKIGCVAEAC